MTPRGMTAAVSGSRPLQLLIAVLLLAAGALFRFTNLDRQVFSHDESLTALHISGNGSAELQAELFTGAEIRARDLQRYQRVNPSRGPFETVRILARDDPKHSPLFYALVRVWAEAVGDSVASLRALAALIGILCLPAFYVLAAELFGSRRAAWVALLMMAVSPFHVVYAQEVREYSLWTLVTLGSSVALLRAERSPGRTLWVLYGATVAAGLYSFLFFAFVILAHGAYVGLRRESPEPSQPEVPRALLRRFGVATLAGVLAFGPWLLQILRGFTAGRGLVPDWLRADEGIGHLAKQWVWGASSLFVDSFHSATGPWIEDPGRVVAYSAKLAAFGVILLAILFLLARAPKRVKFFTVTLIVLPAMCLAVPDLLAGGIKSTPARYLVPTYLGIQLAMTYLIAALADSAARAWRRVGVALFCMIVLGGVVSCAFHARSDVWLSKGGRIDIPPIARFLNAEKEPLLVSTSGATNLGNVLALSHRLEPHVRLRVTNEPAMPPIPSSAAPVFVFHPTRALREWLAAEGRELEPVPGFDRLWRIR